MKTLHDDGVSVVEILVSLLILSFSAVTLGGIVSKMNHGWTYTTEKIETSKKLSDIIEFIPLEEEKTDDGKWLNSDAELTLDNNDTLKIASPKIDKTAECFYDVVGRRCR